VLDVVALRARVQRFRQGNRNWRTGGTSGAKGEVYHLTAPKLDLYASHAAVGGVVGEPKYLALAGEGEVNNNNNKHAPPLANSPVAEKGGAGGEGGEGGLGNAMINLLNYLLAVTVLAVPYCLSVAGLVPGLLILIACALFSYWTALLLGEAQGSAPDLETYVKKRDEMV
jgi:hypothetical protein